ncbi:MAG: OmpA family protein [Thermoanaerobaculia bacterium]
MKTLAAVLLLSLTTLPIHAQTEDAEGCKDSSILSRMRSCSIESCDKKDFDKAELRVGPDKEGGPQQKAVEGSVETMVYHCTKNVSHLAIARNTSNALKAAGFTIVYDGPGSDERPAVTARKGGVWVSVETSFNGDDIYYTETVVRSQEMEQQMAATAEEWETAINATGYCSIYGVLFDSGKSSIQTSSAVCLNEMVKLLKKNTAWKMQVEGHTDNVGGKEANAKLSQARAEAVRSWLISHGIPGDRLIAKGFGDTKPIDENLSDAGRSKNRRVDLRKL